MVDRSTKTDSYAELLRLLFDGAAASFDENLQGLLRGPAGADLRRSHLLEEFALRLFDGDRQRASKELDTPYPRLNYQSPREAAETHEGMLAAKALLSEVERPRGLGVMVEALQSRRDREAVILLDLLPAAWGFDDAEFERLCFLPPGWLQMWRNHEVTSDGHIWDRLRRLVRLHEAFRLFMNPHQYAAFWRRQWSENSLIGHRSPWEAFIADGEVALDLIESCMLAQR